MGKESYYRFREEADAADARSRTIMIYTSCYNDFFNPPDLIERMRPDDRVLIAFDVFNSPGGSRDISYDHQGKKILLPYEDLDRRILDIMERDRDPILSKLPKTESEGQIPRFQGLPIQLASHLNHPVFISREFFVLLPDQELKRGVQRLNVYTPGDKVEIGEIWLGTKWRNPSDLIKDPSASERVLVAA